MTTTIHTAEQATAKALRAAKRLHEARTTHSTWRLVYTRQTALSKAREAAETVGADSRSLRAAINDALEGR